MKRILAVLCVVFLTCGCTHALEVTNVGRFIPETETRMPQVKIGILLNKYDDLLNGVVGKLQVDPNASKVKIIKEVNSAEDVEYVLKLERKNRYRASGLNFFISCPGSMVFAQAWAGYKYYIDIDTNSTLLDNNSNVLSKASFKTSYDIRYTSFSRGASTVVNSWFLPILGSFTGFYFMSSYDTKATDEFIYRVEDSYSDYIASKIIGQIKKQQDKGLPRQSE